MDSKLQLDPQADATREDGALAPSGGKDTKATTEPLGFLDAAAKRAFSESEVSQSITIRFLVEKVNEYKDEVAVLRPYQVHAYELDRDLQIERSKNKRVKAQEIVSLSLTTIGGAGMGLALKLSDGTNTALIIPLFLLFAGIVAAGVYLKVAAK